MGNDPEPQSTPWLRALLMTPPVAFAHFVSTFALVFVLCATVARYEQLYFEGDTLLPPVSQVLLSVSHLTRRYWYLLMFAVLFFDTPLLFWLYTWRGRWSWLRDLWVAGFLFSIIFVVLLILLVAEATLDQHGSQQPDEGRSALRE